MVRARATSSRVTARPVTARPVTAPTRGVNAAVLRLQRSVGNRALTRVLATGQRPLARFAEREHKLIGDTAYGSEDQLTLAEGLTMSYGDAVALGDFYESFDRMKDIAAIPGIHVGSQAELRYALEVDIRGGRDAEQIRKAGMNKRWDKYAQYHREQLNSLYDHRNIAHFPNPVEGDLGRSRQELDERKDGGGPLGGGAAYRKWHREALRKAVEAARSGTPLDEAFLTDGFACHFLTDAYSAGHITTPRKSIKDYWDPMVKDFDKKLARWLTDKIEHGKWHWYERGGAYLVKGQSIGNETLAQLTHKLGGTSFGDLVSLIVHDVSGARGVDATVNGTPIHLVGDGGILDEDGRPRAAGAATFQAAVAAVSASLDELRDAYIAADAHGTDLKAFEAAVTQADGLYAAERLIPVPAHGSSVPWKFKTVEALLLDADVDQALSIWGQVRGREFAGMLSDFPPAAQVAVQKALVEPLASGDEDRIRVMLLEIINQRI